MNSKFVIPPPPPPTMRKVAHTPAILLQNFLVMTVLSVALGTISLLPHPLILALVMIIFSFNVLETTQHENSGFNERRDYRISQLHK